MSEIQAIIQDYVSVWNSSDSEARMTIMNCILEKIVFP